MLLNELALAACLVLMITTTITAAAASRRGDQQQVRVLYIFRLGLSLSACSYALHLAGERAGHPLPLLSLLSSFGGTLLIWIGWMEYGVLLRARRRSIPFVEADDGAALPAGAGLPPLNSQARLVLRHAQEEAQARRQNCVDTDHLLLGLLQEPSSTGGHLMQRFGVEAEKVHLALGTQAPSMAGPHSADPLPLTDRARQALTLAGQEAHRFDKSSIGTDHLLLGLVLMGTGAAAGVLFREGMTVERLRDEVQKSRKRG